MYADKLFLDYSIPKTLQLKLSGDWRIFSALPTVDEVIAHFSAHPEVENITFSVSENIEWDSGLISFLRHVTRESENRNIRVNLEGLPQGAQKLLAMALQVSEKIIQRPIVHEPFLERVGAQALRVTQSTLSLLNFLGDIVVSFARFFSGKVYFRREEFITILQKCGSDALPLVSLISALVGIILAFIGAIQLRLFGAQIFIADIVGIAMVRVMGAVMTGVLMSGRTGASFAAELGIMQTNEEIDALRTLGISPVEFLVLPRVMALVIMMPLLTLYADIMGILGGFVISTGVLGLNPVEYWNHTQSAVKVAHLWIGLIHSFVFGIIIAVAGCLRGIRCARSAVAVGEATTSAVVTAITCIVIATAIITFVCQVLGV
ncbi:MAG: ABC transporter permease [Candidatus Omnitrophica bacterium]|jgi:phospholipid/cholesterol/gamma-HCH transport system permease protein|nr:ABC transporter permease [Candidatus Omnitrophota bacterium]